MPSLTGRLTLRILLGALLVGATVNLAAGARRPMIERAILAGDHYAHAERAAETVRKQVPAGEPLAVVVYDRDMLDELDVAVWFDYRSRWLLYPRHVELFRVNPEHPLQRVPVPGSPALAMTAADYPTYRHVLFFRATAPPVLPGPRFEVLAQDPMWVLARTSAAPKSGRGRG